MALVAASVLAFAGTTTPAGAQDRPILVEYLPEAETAGKRSVAASEGALDGIRGDPGLMALQIGRAAPEPVIQAGALSIVLPGSGETLTFDDLVVEELESGHALYSRDRPSTTSITLVVMGEDVVGTLRHDGAVYGVRPLGDGLTAVYEYDSTQLRGPVEEEDDFVVPDVDAKGSTLVPPHAPAAAEDSEDSREEIDVLVAYSESVKRDAVNVDARIALLLLHMHLTYANSGITTRLRVVHSFETSYRPRAEGRHSDKEDDIHRLRIPDDGELDEAINLRNQYGADVVVLLFRERDTCGGGIAYQLTSGSDHSEWAFVVSGVGVEVCSELDARALAHEIGHVQGATHNPEENDDAPGAYTYGHGFCNSEDNWRTVMSYDTRGRCELTIPHFSNPDVSYEGTATGDVVLRNAARLINETAFTVANFRRRIEAPVARSHRLPLFISAAHPTLQGFVRIINRSRRAGTVTMRAFDDTGQRFGPVTFSLAAGETKHFNSEDLRDGAPGKGLDGRIDGGTGNHWRLELETDLDIEPLAYARTPGEGFLTSTHDVAEGALMLWHVPMFNPGSNTAQQSWLRVINSTGTDTEVRIEGIDDGGKAGAGVVRFDVPGDAARTLSAQALEQGYSESLSEFEFEGRLGDGSGKWQLSVSAVRPVQVMSLLLSETGELTNLSTVTGDRAVRGTANAREVYRGGNLNASRLDRYSVRSAGGDLKAEGQFRRAVPPDAAAIANHRLKLDHAAAPASLRIELPPTDNTGIPGSADGSEHRPPRIGFHRAMPGEFQGDLSSRIDWVSLDDGSIVGTLSVTSPGASATRAGVQAELPAGGEIRFFDEGTVPGHAEPRPVNQDFPVFTRDDFRVDGGTPQVLWSPIGEGDTIGVEIALPSRETLSAFSFRMEKVSHIRHSMDSLRFSANQSSGSLECLDHIDVQCRVENFPNNKETGVARIIVEKSDGPYVCTGTLMDDNVDGTFIAYFLTANHCVSTPVEARTVTAYWFRQRVACGSRDIDARFTVTTGGADLLATSVEQDSTLLQLKRLPTGRVLHFSGWNANPVSEATDVYGLHYPNDDTDQYRGVMKYSSGATADLGDRRICPDSESAGGCFTVRNALDVAWSEGTTEYGSDGSGLFSDRYLIGILAGRGEGCEIRTDHYGAFSDFYPQVSRWLRADSRPPPPPASARVLPLVTPASDPRQTFVRIINRSDRAGTVQIHAIDDSGRTAGPVSLSFDARQTRHLNSRDLEAGNPLKGFSPGVGDGSGNWWLALATDLDIEPLAYVRTSDGFLTSIHDVVAETVQGSMRHHVPIFNPGDNTAQSSWLRVFNTSGTDAEVVIKGLDDRGAPPSTGEEVRFSLPANAARMLSARELEQGYSVLGSEFEFDGRFGDGTGKWQLFVSADAPIQVMSLLFSASGKLTNLSTVTGEDIIWGTDGGDVLYGGSGNDVFNPLDNSTSNDLDADRGYDTIFGSRGDDRYIYTGSGADAYQEVDYSELSAVETRAQVIDGIRVIVDGTGNRATVGKGSAGTDTFVDVAKPLNARGLGLIGTRFNDEFHLTVGDEQFLNVEGGDGFDHFYHRLLDSGWVRVSYAGAPAGVEVDLVRGRAFRDGYGNVNVFFDEIPRGVAGSEHSDVFLGSDRDEVFFGRAGDDTIDGGGGFDRVDFGYSPRFADYVDIQNLEVDLDAGTATGTWNGSPFSYTLSNIEVVWGGSGDDVIRGAVEEVRASPGNDRIVFTDASVYGRLSYSRLTGDGIAVTLDGRTGEVTIDKGSAGLDIIEGLAGLLDYNAGAGFGLDGTNSSDVYNITMGDQQWMQVEGNAGDDTFNIQVDPGSDSICRIDYALAQNGINVDLGAGRAYDDGFGDVDTINGTILSIRGSDFSDVMRGSDIGEEFVGREGDDIIDGRGGSDTLRFIRSAPSITITDLHVDLSTGRATGLWNGHAFSYTISNIENARGSHWDDSLRGDAGDNRLRGYRGNDELEGRGGRDRLEGGGGRDEFIFGPGHGEDRIDDFANGSDTIVLKGLGVSTTDVLSNAEPRSEGTRVWIDLTGYGGGTIDLRDFSIDDLDASDFRIER